MTAKMTVGVTMAASHILRTSHRSLRSHDGGVTLLYLAQDQSTAHASATVYCISTVSCKEAVLATHTSVMHWRRLNATLSHRQQVTDTRTTAVDLNLFGCFADALD